MRTRTAFTLAELMVAIAILIVVIIATARIFGTASAVTGMSEATTDVMQEAAAIERQIRSDFNRLSTDGFFAIVGRAVQNDYNVLSGGPLLDPSQPPDAWIRLDQLVFFTQGAQSIQTIRQPPNPVPGQSGSHKAQSAASRVYYGHAVQFTEGPPARRPGNADYVLAFDPDPASPILPFTWLNNPGNFVETKFFDNVNPQEYQQSTFGPVSVNQPPAKQWVLARHALALARDGGDPSIYLWGSRVAPSIAHRVVTSGRVDAAAQQLNDIKRFMELAPVAGGFEARPWLDPAYSAGDQRSLIRGQMFYPRAERVAPSAHRVDQALTNHVIAGACSSFTVDWTYADRTGDATNSIGTNYRGAWIDRGAEQPWFGLDAQGPPSDSRGVRTFGNWVASIPAQFRPQTIFADAIEKLTTGGSEIIYEAYFGYNRDAPFLNAAGLPDSLYGAPDVDAGYTPWPTAIRITMRLHDVSGRLEAGRVVQFVIDLPRRDQ